MNPQEPLIRWAWVAEHAGEIRERLLEHLFLTVLAVGLGFALSLALALLARRRARLRASLLAAAGILYAIPSLALFALFVPLTGLSVLTAEIGLIGYTLLILVRSILNGLDAVPAEVRDTALGLGHTRAQLLWRVELPLALPVIVGGLRVATVTTVGLVTVTALIGEGGFGYFILQGLQRFASTPLIVGATLSVALAIVADIVLVLTQRWAAPWARPSSP